MNICITGHVLCSVYGDSFEDYQASDSKEMQLIDRNFKTLPKVRRTDRLSRLCLYTTIQLLEKDPALREELQQTGIAMSSKYGPYKVCKEYIEQVKSEGYDMGSPTLFSATVPNAGIGLVCRGLGLHGPMISERGSDGIVTAVHMLKSGKADVAYSIAVDEISEALTVLTAKQEPERFSEVCNLIALESEEHARGRNAQILGSLQAVQSYAVRKSENKQFDPQSYEERLRFTLQTWEKELAWNPASTAVLLSSREGTLQWQVERDFFRNALPEQTVLITPKDFFGESFAASFQNSILYGLMSDDTASCSHIVALDADFEESKVSVALLDRSLSRSVREVS